MKKAIVLIIVFLFPLIYLGQSAEKVNETKRNSVYFEFFGQGLYNSISFDRLYHIDKAIKTSFSGGLTVIPHPELFVLAAPISYNYLFGKSAHHLELGIGFTAMYLRQGRISTSENFTDQNGNTQTNSYVGHSTDFYSFISPKIGYRLQKPTGGLFLRLTFTPPIAGINRIGEVKGGKYSDTWPSYNEYFTSAAFFGYRIFPWGGFSIGWTLKK